MGSRKRDSSGRTAATRRETKPHVIESAVTKPIQKTREELDALLGRFSDARSILECAVRSLEEWHDPSTGIGDELICLRHGLTLLGAVYNDFDLAILRCGQ